MKNVVAFPLQKPATGTGPMTTDVALVASIAAGSNRALGELYDRHHEVCRRFLARLGAQDEYLDDLVQNTFLEVGKAAPRYRGSSQVRTWILGIASNMLRHHRRTDQRRKALMGAYANRPDRDVEPDPDRASREAALADGIAALPHDHRELLVMCSLEGTSAREAAATLGLTEGTVWRRLHEARAKLREHVRRVLP
jgi:RNA polymerase sigma-70 factor (ECF subfamily)